MNNKIIEEFREECQKELSYISGMLSQGDKQEAVDRFELFIFVF